MKKKLLSLSVLIAILWGCDVENTSQTEEKEKTATYTITYDLTGGSWKNGVITEKTLPTAQDIEKVGYDFVDWYDENGNRVTQITNEFIVKHGYDKSGKKVTQIIKIANGNITLYANWKVQEKFILVESATITDSDGSEVIIPYDFEISDHELTQAEYEEYCSYTGSGPSRDYGMGINYPAYKVSWYDAIVYCNRRSIAERRSPCYTINGSTNPDDWKKEDDPYYHTWEDVTCTFYADGYRLPTIAEWEYAARGGNKLTGTQYKYAGSDTIDDVAWYKDNSGNKTHEVKGKKANELGLYDMSGNVGEWCWDFGVKRPNLLSSWQIIRDMRVFCGGSWEGELHSCELDSFFAYGHGYASAHGSFENIGFRIVRGT